MVLTVGNNRGMGQDVPLRYAENDARRVASAFREQGGAGPVRLLLGEDAEALQRALETLRAEVSALKRRGASVLLVVYYSGHGDSDFLRMSQTRLTWSKFKDLVGRTGADTVVGIIDACESGGATTAKGATYGEPFPFSWSQNPSTRGSVWLSSSRSSEASYESDELGGSVFSHYLISGLRGSADLNADRRVTVSELYKFSYDSTVGRTSLALRRTQHPTYRFDLKGEGELVLTWISSSRTSLVFPRELQGTYYLARRFGSVPDVIEVKKRGGELTRVGIAAGSYLVYRKDPDRIWVAPASVAEGRELVFDPRGLRPRAYTDVLSKGGRVSLSTWRAYALGSVQGPVLSGAPATPAAGMGLSWRHHLLGALAEVGLSTFQFHAVDTDVANLQLEGSLRAEIFWELPWLNLSLSSGLTGQVLRQKPVGGPAQVSLSPGLMVGAAVERALFWKLFLRGEVAGVLWFVRATDGAAAALRPQGSLAIGFRIR